MAVRRTLLKRCRASKSLGFQTNVFPYKRLTLRQFNEFLKIFPMMAGARITEMIKSHDNQQLQEEVAQTIYGKFNTGRTSSLQEFPSGRPVKSEGCQGITQSLSRYLHRKGSHPVSEIERLNDTNRKLSLIYGPLPPRKTGKKRETNWNKHLLMMLESRLDVILVRAGFCCSIYQARQFVRRQLVTVNNGLPVSGADLCEPGDVIRVDSCLRPLIAEFWLKQERDHMETQTPGNVLIPRALNLEVDLRTLTVIYLFPPQRILLPALIDFDARIFKK